MSERQRPGHVDPAVYTRRRILVVAAAVALPLVAYSQLRGRKALSTAPLHLSKSTLTVTTTPIDPPKAAPTIAPQPPAPTTTFVAFDHDIGPGSNSSEVTRLQDRLRRLGFDPGPSDAAFGPSTERAVWAFEKFILDTEFDAVTGIVTPEMWSRINEPIEVRPRRSNPGTHLEILLANQVAVLYVNDTARLITHISSGSGEEWCDVVIVDNDDGSQTEQGICGIAVTPGGVFHFERRVTGWRNSKLGRLYNPVYFNYGIAVHGASNVPNYPVSHGCVRIPMHIAEYFPSLVSDGDLVYVFDGIEEPETYGAQLPVFDYPDPDFTTTTTTPTTTTTTTTQPATTVAEPAHDDSTTTAAPTTTTAVPSTSTVGEGG